MLDRPFPVRAGARSGALVDHPQVPQDPALERRLGEPGLKVAGVSEPERPLGAGSALGLAQGSSERVGAHDPDRRHGRGHRHRPVVLV